VTAESCTGGGIASAVTDIAGSSAWFDRAFVTYSNEAKMDMLGVNAKTLKIHGAVSQEVVLEMAAGAIKHSVADVAISVSGIAGPGGGSDEKPVGTVWFGWKVGNQIEKQHCVCFDGDRGSVREQACCYALQELLLLL
jgi:nicotinamide-nucleotide amidase